MQQSGQRHTMMRVKTAATTVNTIKAMTAKGTGATRIHEMQKKSANTRPRTATRKNKEKSVLTHIFSRTFRFPEFDIEFEIITFCQRNI